MRVMLRHRNLIGKTGAKPFNRPSRGLIVRVARNRHGVINGPNEWRNSTTSLKRVTVTSKLLPNLETDVPRANLNMLGVADSKIDVADIQTIDGGNAKVIRRNKIACRVAWDDSNKMQSYLTERQVLGRCRQRLDAW